MRFSELPIIGAWSIEPEPRVDNRGEFARTFCAEEFAQHGLAATMCQTSISTNLRRGTLRGMHFRPESDNEAKLVRCTQGKVCDVIVDVRPGSKSFKKWVAVELSAHSRNALYIPPGCAHGFITLMDNTELFYMMSAPYKDGSERGVRWNDPAFAIAWPLPPIVISDRDAQYPDYQPHLP